MTEDVRAVVTRLVRELYRPFDDVADLVLCFARVVLAATQSPRVEISLSGSGAEDEVLCTLGSASCGDPALRPAELPIRSRGAEIGRMSVFLPAGCGDEVCRWATAALSRHLERRVLIRLAWEKDVAELSCAVTRGLGAIGQAREPAEAAAVPASPGDRHPALQRAVHYIGENFDRKLSLAEVAASAFVSPSHLAHLFQQELRTSFTHFLAAVRVERAKRLLREEPRAAITCVAGDVGFSDLRHFERTFKGMVGCTPKVFRLGTGPRGPEETPDS